MKKLFNLFFFFTLLQPGLHAQSISPYIVTDQLGYRPDAKKIAILRDPVEGFDASETYTPGGSLSLINAVSGTSVFDGSAVLWKSGATDPASGDKVWWFDFSSYVTPGRYYVLDVTNNLRSYEFEIREDVYNEVLKHAVRTFFYQRSGFAKQAPYAETGWTDGASHIGPLQDSHCRLFSAPNNASTEKDLHGGWYDAGDYNKYTTWTGNYIIELLKAYEEAPTAWTDDYNIPESGNGIPDLLDEIKWGMDFMRRLQNDNGSLISIVGVAHASPPSAASARSLYGDVNTSATLKAAAAFAYGSKVFRNAGLSCYADTLKKAAQKAWDWADANPAVIWSNTNSAYTSAVSGSGGGDMEVDDYGRTMFKLQAAVHLYEITGNAAFKTFFDNNYLESHLIQWHYTYPFEVAHQETMLYYTKLNNATASVVNMIRSRYNEGIEKANAFGAYDAKTDAYNNYLGDYTWGSNGIKCNQGNMLYDVILYNLNASRNSDALDAAEQYIHYIHGLNPLHKFYLSNYNSRGADNSVAEFYHSWFEHGSALWDKVGVSTYGPAPGFLVGGANPGYKTDACCESSCGSPANTALCTSVDLSTVRNQPDSKSYMDFNESWPVNSWEVTENSCGYQVPYIRLLSKFVKKNGTTLTEADPCEVTNTQNPLYNNIQVKLYPSPSQDHFYIETAGIFQVNVYATDGRLIESKQGENQIQIGEHLLPGCYQIQIVSNEKVKVLKAVKYK